MHMRRGSSNARLRTHVVYVRIHVMVIQTPWIKHSRVRAVMTVKAWQ